MHPEVVLAHQEGSPRPRRRRGFLRGLGHYCPYMFYVLIGFIILKQFVPDVRATIFTLGNFSISWLEIVYLVVATIGILEQLKVAEPKQNNVWEAIAIGTVFFVYVILFVVAATGTSMYVPGTNIMVLSYRTFSNTEFLMLTLYSGFVFVCALIINSATLQVQVTNQ